MCVLLKLHQPKSSRKHLLSDTNTQSQTYWLAAAREDPPEERWPRWRRSASSRRCVVLRKGSERSAGNSHPFWTGCFLRWGQGRQLGILSTRWFSKVSLRRHWDKSGNHSFYSRCMTLGEMRSPVSFAAAFIHVLSA